MRRAELLVGLVLLLGSAYGYLNSSSLIAQAQDLVSGSVPHLFPKMSQTNASATSFDVNQPQINNMVRVTHYGFMTLAVCGLAALCYGLIAKKQTPTTEKKKSRK